MIDLLGQPHHDGSALYCPEQAPPPGATVPLFLRVPRGAGVGRVHVRTAPDAEPRYTEAVVDREDGTDTWWRADVRIVNPETHYRFLLDGGPYDYRWCTAEGVVDHDGPDRTDFVLASHALPPAWLADTVVYQVFPDRFASSGAPKHWPDWAIRSAWDDPISTGWREAVSQVYGGDLAGLEAHLDHIEALGANLVYLTPFFPGRSSHRYDASSFEHVDPLLGGDGALASLVDAAHRRGIRVIGDLTTNHTGAAHEWFQRAQADAASTEAGFYTFREHPDDYVAWFDVPSLPKLDHRSDELRQRLIAGDDAIVARWLRPPFDLDGWRIDVANMTGRQGEIDVHHDVARAVRAAMAGVKPDTWVVAEHCYDASGDLAGDGWHGTMNYAGFTRPVITWLGGARPDIRQFGYPVATPVLPGESVVRSMRSMAAAMGWRATTASLTLLDSHDTARFRTVVGRPELHVVGLAFLMTYPGVPMVFAGDEIGLEGDDADRARRTMDWDPARWDAAAYEAHRSLIRLRRSSEALRRGGLRWVHIGADVLVFLRETADERVLVHLARRAHADVRLAVAGLGLGPDTETLFGARPLTSIDGAVTLTAGGPVAGIWRIGPNQDRRGEG
jgi:alpha-glucosidase